MLSGTFKDGFIFAIFFSFVVALQHCHGSKILSFDGNFCSNWSFYDPLLDEYV